MPNSPDMFNDSETVTSEDSETISASIDNIDLNNSQSLPTGQQSFAGIDSDNYSITKKNTNIDNNCTDKITETICESTTTLKGDIRSKTSRGSTSPESSCGVKRPLKTQEVSYPSLLSDFFFSLDYNKKKHLRLEQLIFQFTYDLSTSEEEEEMGKPVGKKKCYSNVSSPKAKSVPTKPLTSTSEKVKFEFKLLTC